MHSKLGEGVRGYGRLGFLSYLEKKTTGMTLRLHFFVLERGEGGRLG